MQEQLGPVKPESARAGRPPPPNATADQIVLFTKTEALRARMKRRAPAIREEMEILLDGVADAAFGVGAEVEKGNALLQDAEARFERALQTSNRNWYLVALLCGVIVLAALASVTIGFAGKTANLADRDTIISLFTFAGMGSVTSVLTRLDSLDLRGEVSRKFVFYSAVAKPLVAVSFASVVYVILKNNLVSIGTFDETQLAAVIWVATFLCGFSERFAEDMISRVIPARDSNGAGAGGGTPGVKGEAAAKDQGK